VSSSAGHGTSMAGQDNDEVSCATIRISRAELLSLPRFFRSRGHFEQRQLNRYVMSRTIWIIPNSLPSIPVHDRIPSRYL